PHCHFRGLLRLYSRYSPPNRSTAQGGLCHEASAQTLHNRAARQLPDLSTIIRVEPSSTSDSRRQGALPDSELQPAIGRVRVARLQLDSITIRLTGEWQSRSRRDHPPVLLASSLEPWSCAARHRFGRELGEADNLSMRGVKP